MNKTEVLEMFDNSPSKLAKALGITVSAVEKWGDTVPNSRRQTVRLAMRARAEELEQEARMLRAKAKEGQE
jgi:hypothetical protein